MQVDAYGDLQERKQEADVSVHVLLTWPMRKGAMRAGASDAEEEYGREMPQLSPTAPRTIQPPPAQPSTGDICRHSMTVMVQNHSPLLALPHELLLDILSRLDPRDVSALGRTCSHLNHLIETSSGLWRILYLARWDLPHEIGPLSVASSSKGKEVQEAALPSMQELVKQRRKARGDLRRGTTSLHRMVSGKSAIDRLVL